MDTRIQTADKKEIGAVKFSRVVFNNDMTMGYFYFTFFKNELNAYGLLLVVEKAKNKWIVKKKNVLWVS